MGLSEILVQGALATILSLGGPQTSSPNVRPLQDIFKHGSENGALLAERQSSHRLQASVPLDSLIGKPTDDNGANLNAPPKVQQRLTGGRFELYHAASRKLKSEASVPTLVSTLPPVVGVLPHEMEWVLEDSFASARQLPQIQAISWIQQATGLSDERTADLLGVSRRGLLNWKAGMAIKERNLRRLLETKDVLQRAQRRHPSREQMLAWLHTPDELEATSPATLLSRGKFDQARFLAVAGPTTVEPSPQPARRPTSSAWQAALQRPELPGEFDDLD